MLIHKRQGTVDFLCYLGKELELRNIRKVRQDFQVCLDNLEKPKHLAFDLKQVSFIDSSAIGFLLATLRSLSLRSCNFYIINNVKQVRETLRAAYIHKLIQVYDDCHTLFEELGLSL